jgi:hypothetical protein
MHSAAPFTFDDSSWPLLGVRLSGEPSRQEFEAYLAKSSQYLRRGERHVCIFDARALRLLSNEQRQRQAEWLKANAALMRQRLLGVAYVITSPVIRLTMSVIFHFEALPVPYAIRSSLSDAGAWAALRLDEAGLRAPAERVRRQFLQPGRLSESNSRGEPEGREGAPRYRRVNP